MMNQPSIVTMADLIAALNRVRIHRGMTLMELNDLAGLQGGYSNKIFCGLKALGPLSLPAILRALDCELMVVLSPSKLKEDGTTRDSYEVFHRKERKKIAASGGIARAKKLDSNRRREIARMAGRASAAKRKADKKIGAKLLKKSQIKQNMGNIEQGELF